MFSTLAPNSASNTSKHPPTEVPVASIESALLSLLIVAHGIRSTKLAIPTLKIRKFDHHFDPKHFVVVSDGAGGGGRGEGACLGSRGLEGVSKGSQRGLEGVWGSRRGLEGVDCKIAIAEKSSILTPNF
jgi:hypothetical protein